LTAVLTRRDVKMASILRRSAALGLVAHGDVEERFLKTPTDARDLICVALAGRAAELQEYGEASSGISSDLAVATTIASQLVGQLGNGPGLLSLDAAAIPGAGNLVSKVISDEASREAAEALMTEGAERAAFMTSKYRDALLRIADGLCATDEMEGADIKAIVAEYADVTERRGPVRIAANRQQVSDSL
jgi:cell division protease FtsH